MSLGSWRTFERISRDDGAAVMRAARDTGINFLDDARYNDETGAAPISTGYSEVVQTGFAPLRLAVILVNTTPKGASFTLLPSMSVHSVCSSSSGVSLKHTTRCEC